MTTFTSWFAEQLKRFLTYKRSLGFTYIREEAFLLELDRVAASWPNNRLSEALVRQYLSCGSARGRSHRLTVVRTLARFLVLEEPRTFVPPRRFLGIRRQRASIRVFSRKEAGRFLSACDALADRTKYPRGLIHGTALRTLLLTGLRRGELLQLHNRDVDLSQEVITVLRGKFGKQRFVPLASDLTQRLRTYRQAVLAHFGAPNPTHAFFPGLDGQHPIAPKSLYRSFRQVLDSAGIEHLGRNRGPRLHDLRHGFAVLRLLAWYEQGVDLRVKLPLLATYLGHVGLTTSQVYLHMTEDLVGEVTKRQRDRFGDLITEVIQ
jgi:integrase